jgi:hypothetical protein
MSNDKEQQLDAENNSDIRQALEAILNGDSGFGTRLVDIIAPVNGQPADVREGYPGACDGEVDFNGKADKPGWDVHKVVADINGFEVNDIEWHYTSPGNIDFMGKASGATIQESPCPTDPDNNLTVFVHWYFTTPTGDIFSVDDHTVTFTGQRAAPSPPASSKGTASSKEMNLLVEPKRLDDGWLEYRDMLSPDPHTRGKILGLNGRALSASVIAVYAPHVHWFNQGKTAIRRPIGSALSVAQGFRHQYMTLRLGGSKAVKFMTEGLDPSSTVQYQTIGREYWKFKDAPKEAICLFHRAAGYASPQQVFVLLSDSEDKPDVFDVAPGRPIYTRVNDSYATRLEHTGTYDLRVKVIA